MPLSAAPPIPTIAQTLTLSGASSATGPPLDLSTSGLLIAVVAAPRWGREAEILAGVSAAIDAGADIVEVPGDPRLIGPAAARGQIPLAVRVATADEGRAAKAAGAAVLLVDAEHSGDLDEVRDEIAIVGLAPDAANAGKAIAAAPNLPVAVDVTGRSGADAVSQESLALAVGARLLRTSDLRRSRRVVVVMSHLLEGRR